jgi:hypothetical protein
LVIGSCSSISAITWTWFPKGWKNKNVIWLVRIFSGFLEHASSYSWNRLWFCYVIESAEEVINPIRT